MKKDFTKPELKWLERLQKLLDSQPQTISGFCTGTSIDFYKGYRLPMCSRGGVDNLNNKHKSVKNKNWDAGAY